MHGVYRAVGRLGVRGNTLELDLRPQHADPAEQRAEAGRFQQHDGITEHACGPGRQRPITRALLLDHAEEGELAAHRVRQRIPECADGQQPHRETGLHVTGAAAGQPAVRPGWRERVRRPGGGFGGHHVDVAVQQQRRGFPRVDPAEHVRPTQIRRLRHAARRSGSGLGRDLQAADAEPEAAEFVGDEFLRAALLADVARLGDEPLKEAEGLFRPGVDGRVP